MRDRIIQSATISAQSLTISRRAALAGAAGTLAAATFAGVPAFARAKDGPAANYMRKRVAKDLFAAAQKKTPESFLRAINRHADLGAISEYSVGSYAEKIAGGVTSRLRKGVAGFMARYFAEQASQYPVVKADVFGEEEYEEDKTVVKSRVYLSTGSSYSVDWLLSEHGKSYKIRDVRILGFWLSPFQRDLFVRYIDKNNGDVMALLAALRV